MTMKIVILIIITLKINKITAFMMIMTTMMTTIATHGLKYVGVTNEMTVLMTKTTEIAVVKKILIVTDVAIETIIQIVTTTKMITINATKHKNAVAEKDVVFAISLDVLDADSKKVVLDYLHKSFNNLIQ